MNQTTIVGNLTRDPILKHASNGRPVCLFTVAVNTDKLNGDRETFFMPVVVFGKMAENCVASLKKATRVIVSGRLEQQHTETTVMIQLIADHVGLSLQFDAASRLTGYNHERETRRIAESLGMIWDGEHWMQPRPERNRHEI